MKAKRMKKVCYLFFALCLCASILSSVAIASVPSNSGDFSVLQEPVRYLQVPCAEEDAMYVGKDVETGELSYFNVETTGATAYVNANGEIERSAPAYSPPELVQEQF